MTSLLRHVATGVCDYNGNRANAEILDRFIDVALWPINDVMNIAFQLAWNVYVQMTIKCMKYA